MRPNLHRRRRGFALFSVLLASVVIFILAATLYFNTRSQTATHARLTEQTKALMAARAAMQLAQYKFRMLPTEFYAFDRVIKTGTPDQIASFTTGWMGDFDPTRPNTAAAKLSQSLGATDGGSYQLGIATFSLITRTGKGYTKDFLQITSWGSFNGVRRSLDALIEVEVTH